MMAIHRVTNGLFLCGIAAGIGGAGCGLAVSSDCASSSDCPSGDGGTDGGDGSVGADGGADSSISTDGPRGDSASDSSAHDGASDGSGCTAPNTLDCNGTCVDPTLPSHCGTCTNVCAGPDGGHATCTGGVCGVGCTAPASLDCNGACVDPSDPQHCGSCSNACPGPTTGMGAAQCTLGADGGGECSVSCSGSTTEVCGSSCYAPTDPNHCGSCSNACPAPTNGSATCASPPACGIACNTGYHPCGSACDSDGDVPSNTGDPCIVSERFGFFVSPTGSDSAAGTQLAPVKTVGHAMDLAKAAGKRVYACGSAGSYDESLVVGASRDGVSVYGGLNCATPSQWTYSAADVATLAPSAAGSALQVTGITTGVTFEDFGFVSAAGASAGQSSVAVFVASAAGVVMRRCSVQAGAGVSGQDQTQPSPYTSNAPDGNPGTAASGGAFVKNMACTSSSGGAGGQPGPSGGDGNDGTPGPSNKQTVAGCLGTTAAGSGAAGSPGSAGAGAGNWASFTATSWTPASGATGSVGTVAQGGGGGAAVDSTGGGGSGGAGGCGGAAGPAGTGGGSSIDVLAYQSSVDLESCTLTATSAGRGGNGAAGQLGQTGGAHGGISTGSNACTGGKGGAGGNGGGGGGGAGGLSAGVVWTGTPPTINGTSTPSAATLTGVTVASGGAAGTGGQGNAKAGTQGAVVQFQ